jgi:ABC-type lipoprotein release transport system permease subunit
MESLLKKLEDEESWHKIQYRDYQDSKSVYAKNLNTQIRTILAFIAYIYIVHAGIQIWCQITYKLQ